MTPGSEPRHAAHARGGGGPGSPRRSSRNRPASGRRTDEDASRFPSISEQVAEQLGGVRGLIESSIPVLAFVLLNVLLGDIVAGLEKRTALYWAIGGAVGTAVADRRRTG